MICIISRLPWYDFILENGVSEKSVSSSTLLRNELRLGSRASFKEKACSPVMPVREQHQTPKAVLLRLKHLMSCESTSPTHRVWGRASDSACLTSSQGMPMLLVCRPLLRVEMMCLQSKPYQGVPEHGTLLLDDFRGNFGLSRTFHRCSK